MEIRICIICISGFDWLNTNLKLQRYSITDLFSVNDNSSVALIKNSYEKRISMFLNVQEMAKGTSYNICAFPYDYYPNGDVSFTCISRNGIVCVITIASTGLMTLTPTTGNMANGDVIQAMQQTYAISV